jgi:hypothetical protein
MDLDKMEFVGGYRGHEIFSKWLGDGTEYIAFGRFGINPVPEPDRDHEQD